MVGSPSGPEPRRLAGCLVRNCGEHRETDRHKSPGQEGPENEKEREEDKDRERESPAYRSSDRRIARGDRKGGERERGRKSE